jgi:benzoyl-CoA reductase/2-hydroxyglutaryl-CoA dehydratase subunit BcrC/BadD/HgdB
VGCFPPYNPEEIVHAAGLLPIGLWGGQVEFKRVREVLPVFACSILQSAKELEMRGGYDILAAVIVPSPCDTLKAIGQKWANKKLPCIQFVHPQHREVPAAMTYLTKEYNYVRERLEKAIGEKISDEAVAKSIVVYNKHRKVMREFAETAAQYPHIINPIARHTVYKSAYFMLKEDHTALVTELTEALKKEAQKPWDGIKVIVTGIMLEPDALLQVFIDLKIAIAADDLAHESHQYRYDVRESGNPIESLAKQWQDVKGFSLAYEKEKLRGPILMDMKKKYGADGVVFCLMKFCDPEEFDYPVLKREFEEAKIPLLHIEIEQQMQSVEQVRTRLQSFAEIVSRK